jgi:UDP-N-acetylglucosamine--N-acetylmuramyl-(pentapeptide) pyrophosphoryl-undecaprenol N-acetylglucosamine transferase
VIPEPTERYKSLPYIHDMARAYVAADVIIARSGAITCSEVRALGKFAIFVPLAIGNGEQAVNALELAAHGGAVIIDQESFTPRWLIDNISNMIMQNAKNAPGVDTRDLDASTKITALMDYTLRNYKA